MKTYRCEVCGKEYESKTTSKYCQDCRHRAYQNKANALNRETRRMERLHDRLARQAKPMIFSTQSIEDVNREARSNGMSYGEYVAKMRM